MLPEIVDVVREVQLPLLAVLLLFGAVAKTTTGAAMSGLAVLLNERLRRPVTVASGLLEAVLAAGLLVLAGTPGGLARAGTAALFAVSVGVLLLARRRDPEAGCGCFGGLSRAPIGWRTLTRAGLLSVAALSTLGLDPTGWQVVTDPTATHAVVMGVELAVLAVLSPEPRELATRLLNREPCALRPVSRRRTMARLRSSDVWRTNRPVLLGTEPEDVWRHGCWRFLRYDGMRHGRRVDVVFAVRVGGRGRTAVRAVLVDRASGTVAASFGAVTTRPLQGPPRRLPRPRAAAKRDEAVRDAERQARGLRAAREHPAARPTGERETDTGQLA
ncbi:methylamine utilization protein MauD [Nocardiopsis sp. EMB25]|uniref:MauE/DoxX family redox-associated membrane protein n=1 Tax=Nocardiopsis sp. EMB25 TaxID=2835867 RepID=UPI002283FECE|nr:MauE/DoxX family redox-associated membrane protein [Nocardiopsis sp. EMB25]MCY9786865.1 methylamine utilization protein MauD [Nocardiopsis sp. EMB25]